MALAAGARLGPYEVLGPLGAGGMGEVYKAKDTRLDRTVAVKILPAHLSTRPEVRARFEREARAVSGLNHPHICVLHDVGSQDGVDYLVLEYLEGETLADRLEKSALPTEQLLQYAIEIADALDKAHRSGIVHRDLKPGNIMLTKSGAKLMDFGLARTSVLTEGLQGRQTRSPTMSQPLTAEGTILGTFQYMAPEQLEGREADARSDLFAFGATLYEMATGRKAFVGKSQASLISAIMSSEPPAISTVQPLAPAALNRVVKQCLAKDPDERWQSAGDLKRELAWIATGGAAPAMERSQIAAPRRRALTWAPWAVAVALGLGGVWVGSRIRVPIERQVLRANLTLPSGAQLDADSASMEFSPDGRTIAFSLTGADGKQQIWTRSLDSLAAQPLAGTEGGFYPFWSPDGRFIGFFGDHRLKKIPASGGTPQTVCEAKDGRGASWSARGIIVFAPQPLGGLESVPDTGGTPTPVTKPNADGGSHRFPQFLPDGRHLLFLSFNDAGGTGDGISSLDLQTNEVKLVARERSAGIYTEPGYLVFVRKTMLMAQRFDLETLQTRGEAVPIAEDVQFNLSRGAGNYAVSSTGLLLYRAGSVGVKGVLTWSDLEGHSLGSVGDPAQFESLSLSPDDRRAAVVVRDDHGVPALWIYDLERGVPTRLTFGPETAPSPSWGTAVWSPDGKQVAYSGAAGRVYRRNADGSGPDGPVFSVQRGFFWFSDWSPDGSMIALCASTSERGADVEWMSLSGDHEPHPFLATKADETGASFSPDGKWLAYTSNESGRDELYVVPFPGPGGKWQISSGNMWGTAVWRGRLLSYATVERKVKAVEVTPQGSELIVGVTRTLFGGKLIPGGGLADFSHDGKRVLEVFPTAEAAAPTITLVSDWTVGLKRR